MKHELCLVIMFMVFCGIFDACSTKHADIEDVGDTTPSELVEGVTAISLTSSPSETPTSSSLPPSLTPQITVTPTLTSTPIRPTPVLPMSVGKDFYLGDLLFGEEKSPVCILPCWYDLTIGRSKSDDVQHVLDTVFDFNGTLDFFATAPPNKVGLALLGADTNDISGLYTSGYMWEVVAQNAGYLYFVTGVSEDTKDLEIFGFHWETPDTNSFEVHMSPQRVLLELGVPMHTLVSAQIQMGGEGGIVTFMMIYEQGMVFQFLTEEKFDVSYTDATHSSFEKVVAELCLGNTKTQSGISYISADAYIVSPFRDGLNDLSSVQKATVETSIARDSLVPVQDIFGITSEEIVQRVLEQGDVCLRSKDLLGE